MACFTGSVSAAERTPVTVHAAASLTNVLGELGAEFEWRPQVPVKFSFAASSLLAKQIEAGTKADVFVSADQEWMGYLATGDPVSVPVGRYARAALTKLGVWAAVEAKIAGAENVRAALAFVSRGEAPLGIVYATDAKVDPKVRVVDTFPVDTHPPITYPAAAVKGAQSGAALRPYSDSRNASSAARSSACAAAKRVRAASASSPCHRIASSRLRARPSCRYTRFRLSAPTVDSPQSGAVRHS